ncbi:MAG TPA: thiosulfate oxidation carrier protein SoxY, partial [Burkholderiales bacterium]|nr:thiosulfate oxidation carrier protein SoxY [Burkholderiales bacterium]
MLLRRDFLRLALRASASALAAASGLFNTALSFAASWNKNAFEAKAVSDALNNLGASRYVESRDIVITAPDIAENGAVVPIAVNSRIPNT